MLKPPFLNVLMIVAHIKIIFFFLFWDSWNMWGSEEV